MAQAAEGGCRVNVCVSVSVCQSVNVYVHLWFDAYGLLLVYLCGWL